MSSRYLTLGYFHNEHSYIYCTALHQQSSNFNCEENVSSVHTHRLSQQSDCGHKACGRQGTLVKVAEVGMEHGCLDGHTLTGIVHQHLLQRKDTVKVELDS